MATTDSNGRRLALRVLAGVAVVIGGGVLYSVWSRPPQMGTSGPVFQTVDALYTAVRNRDERRVTECERQLHMYRDAGTLPPAAGDALDAVVRTARSGEWQPAAERLYEFMLAQRRDGAIAHRHIADQKGKSKVVKKP